jgi:hypothetical protein
VSIILGKVHILTLILKKQEFHFTGLRVIRLKTLSPTCCYTVHCIAIFFGSSFLIAANSVSNPVYTDTGIPVFGTPNADTGNNLPVFAGIEDV